MGDRLDRVHWLLDAALPLVPFYEYLCGGVRQTRNQSLRTQSFTDLHLDSPNGEGVVGARVSKPSEEVTAVLTG